VVGVKVEQESVLLLQHKNVPKLLEIAIRFILMLLNVVSPKIALHYTMAMITQLVGDAVTMLIVVGVTIQE